MFSSRWRRDRYNQIVITLTATLLIFLLFRLIFRAFGASDASLFVSFVYAITEPLVLPFIGISGSPTAGRSVFDIPAVVALIVYPILIWLGARIALLYLSRPQPQRYEATLPGSAEAPTYPYPEINPASVSSETAVAAAGDGLADENLSGG